MSTAELKLAFFRELDTLPEDVFLMFQEKFRQLLKQAKAATKRKAKPKPKGILGLYKGQVMYMAPDFNAPLEDFKDYM